MPTLPSASPGHFLLTLDNQPVIVKSVDGGNIKGEVVTINQGLRQAAQKRISALTLEPFAIAVGISMGKPLVDWIHASLDLSPTRKSGSVVSVNTDNKAQGYRHFRDALISEVTFSAMDASNKEAAGAAGVDRALPGRHLLAQPGEGRGKQGRDRALHGRALRRENDVQFEERLKEWRSE